MVPVKLAYAQYGQQTTGVWRVITTQLITKLNPSVRTCSRLIGVRCQNMTSCSHHLHVKGIAVPVAVTNHTMMFNGQQHGL